MLVRDARDRPELWRLTVGLVIVGGVAIFLNLTLSSVIFSLGSARWVSGFQAGATPSALLILLSSFGFITLGVKLAAGAMQNRPLHAILGPRRLGVRQFWRVLLALGLLAALIFILPPYNLGAPFKPNLAFETWLLLLPLSLTAVLIQTSAEEILFRGYIQQSLAARFRSRLIWMGLPALLFAAGHYAPATSGENALLIAIWAGAFGLINADLTARSGTLGPAIALHFFNNVVALLFFSIPDNLSGLALFLLPYDMSQTDAIRHWLYVDFVMMVVCWLTARLALRR